jgi:putative transposase
MIITYRRNLPHIHPEDRPIFITFRLANSLPVEVLEELSKERAVARKQAKNKAERYHADKEYFARYDDWLDRIENTPRWLGQAEIARIVKEKIHELAEAHYHLFAYCIMPNHVHLLIQSRLGKKLPEGGTTANYPITDALRLLKGSTARKCNLELGRSGAFWTHESYDHFIRDEREFGNVIGYILNNPVKAGLVDGWMDWRFSYVHPDLGEW